MKFIKIISLLIVLLFSVVSCGRKNPEGVSNEFLVVTSFYPVYIIAKNVTDGIDGVKVVNMTPPVTGCLHDYSITSSDMKKLENAGVFLYNGAGMESFTDKIAVKYPRLKTFELSKGISLIGGVEGVNPHVWVSVNNAIIMTRNCSEALSESDPGNAGRYKKNALMYVKELEGLKNEMAAALGRFSGRKIITFHEAFPYFAEEFSFKIAAVVEREPGSEPSAREISETINLVRREKIKILFAEPQYPHAAADVIARETGAVVYTLDPAVTGDDDRGAYVKIMKKNLSVLLDAFGK